MNKQTYERARRILAKMTLAEKIGQLWQKNIGDTSGLGNTGKEINGDLFEKIRQGRVGIILQPAWNMLDDIREAQRIAVEESRLKIPLMVHSDIIHGFDTVFPLPVASACSFNPVLIRKSAAVAAEEATAAGINVSHAPMLDIARDARWGRIAESPGEDPFLAGEIAEAYVKGFQEDNAPAARLSATLKHYAGYGAAEGGRDYNTCEIGERTMRNIYLLPFRKGINAGARLVMAGFHTIDNVPMTANTKYLRDVLRGEFGFGGPVISDWCAPYELIAHGIAEDEREAALAAFCGGIDIEMCSDCYDKSLYALLKEGIIREHQLDEAVLRVLELKIECGIMDDPYVFMKKKKPTHLSKVSLGCAEMLADESIVLLKNEGILPISSGQKVMVAGSRCKDNDVLGCWQCSSFSLEAINYIRGLREEGFVLQEMSDEKDISCFDADTVLVFVGEKEDESGEAASKQELSVAVSDIAILRKAKESGKKTVCIVCAGRPLILTEAEKYSDAVIYAWYLGHTAGRSLAGVLSGRVCPSGKLSVTMPRSMGQIPVYYNYLPTGRPRNTEDDNKFTSRYIDGTSEPLYPFGFGMSYTRFRYSPVRLSSEIMKENPVKAAVTLENCGTRTGKETVQLYIHDVCATISRPVRELKGFRKVFLQPGQCAEIEFEIDEKMLSYYHSDNRFFCDAGKFEIYIGGDSTTKNCAVLQKN